MSHVPCKFYKQGTCTAGANCTFSHSSDLSSQAVCKFYLKGNCKFGTKCALLHTMSPFGSSGSSSSSRFIPNQQQQNYNSRFIPMTPPNPSQFMDFQSLGTSAPSAEQQIWSRSYLGQSPHESSSIDYLLGTSPFSPTRTRHISSSYDSRPRQVIPNGSKEIPIPQRRNFDDEFQFLMDDEETLSSHPSLLSLPN